MKLRHKGKKSKDVCSCWVCRDRKYREDRQKEKREAINTELNMYSKDDDIIFDYEMKATYGI